MSIYRSIKKVLAPNVISSQVKYGEVLLRHLRLLPRWLDLGCGARFLPDWAWIPDEELLRSLPRLAGVDLNLDGLRQHPRLRERVQCDVCCLPFRSGSFDLVTANMVMEHVCDPDQVLSEVHRVLAPGGMFLCHTPNRSSPLIAAAARIPQRPKNRLIGFFEDRAEDEIYPAVYRFNTLGAIASMSARAGFSVEQFEFVVSEAVTQVLGLLSIPELLYIRLTQWERLRKLRPDIIAVLRRKEGNGADSPETIHRT